MRTSPVRSSRVATGEPPALTVVPPALESHEPFGLGRLYCDAVAAITRLIKPDSALAVFRKIQATDTAFVPVYLWLGLTYTELGRYEEGLDAIRKATLLAGRSPVLLTAGAFIRARMGDTRGAREVIGELENLSKEMYVSPYYFGEIYNALGETDAAIRWFERAIREKSGAVVYMKVSPTLKSLRNNREFRNILRSAGFD